MFEKRKHRKGITIIVPVYADWTSLSECIQALKKHAPDSARIVIVNDKGPKADLLRRNITTAIEDDKRFKYYDNKRNLGFVKTCNLAVKRAKRCDDILLLNSDAELTEGAAEEMRKALYSAENVASVSPRSNRASIFSIPYNVSTMNGENISAKKSYEIYKTIRDKLPEAYETPTTHGFCMLIRRSVINKHGLFDEIFGVGYGEENDFCMRVRKQGYKHLIANRAYVFHEGSKSFSQETRNERIAKNIGIIAERYPDYGELVDIYIKQNVLPEIELLADAA